MRTMKMSYYLIIIIIFASISLCNTSLIYGNTKLNNINVVLDDNYPPFSFRNTEGALQGITIEQWRLFEKKTGIKINITGMEWNKAFTSMRNGLFDVVDTISYNDDREKYLDFSKPYATIDVPIFFQRNITGITGVDSLKGFIVGAKKGDNSINVLKKNGISNIVVYDSAEAVVKAAKEQKLTIFVLGKPPGLYYMYKMEIQDMFNFSNSLYTSKFYRAVKEGNKDLLSIINTGFSKISQKEYNAIDKKWYGNTNPSFFDFEFFKVIIIVIIIISILVLFLFLVNITLKNKVKQKTEELSSSLEKLKRSEYTFRKLFEESTDAILIMDKDKYTDCNPSALTLLGYDTKDKIIGKSPWELSMEKQPDGEDSKEKALNILNTSKKNIGTRFEWWHQKSDGSLLPVEIMLTSILLNEKNVFHILWRDISQRKQMELELEYLSYHDQLTGLYNRRFYEEELKRLDVRRSLPLTIVMADVNGLKLVNDSFGHSTGDDILKKIAELLTHGCRAEDIIARLGGDEFIILLPNTDGYLAEQIVKRIKALASNEKIGSVSLSVSFGWETKEHEEERVSDIFKKAEDHMYKKKLFEGPSMRGKTIQAIINTLHEKNKREEQHYHRVSMLCQNMGRALGLLEAEIEELKTVGLLHDIGKIAIDENILNKPGKLTVEEWDEIKRHPEIGYRILSTVNDMAEMAEYVLAHHERYDGRGYPKGLKGDEIPLQSRIIAIADAYDAMTSERSYRSALTENVAIEELRKSEGIQFDSALVDLFIKEVLGNPKYQDNKLFDL